MIFAKRSTPVKSVVSAKKLVKEALDLATSGSQIVSSIEFPPSLNPLYVDEGQISQVFSCICINAVQAMAEGGTLTVRARNVSTETEKLLVPESGDYLELSFQDQGGGIAELDQPHIFTPYFTTKAEVGHGLGLATVYSIITRHGGGISFHSTLGKGTTFVLYLPVAKNGEAELQPLEKAENYLAGQGRSILVMDDEEMIRSFVQTVLEEQGYRVVSCSSGDQALALYREAYPSDTPYMAAILDLTVPGGIGGKEVARRILELDPHARLIVSSGHYNDVVVKDFKNYGFCAAAVKPYHANELLDLLSKLPE
jgi:CheY-like chemotaxis protein